MRRLDPICQPVIPAKAGTQRNNVREALFIYFLDPVSDPRFARARDDDQETVQRIRTAYKNSDKSFHSGLPFSISSSFQALRHFLICFSRVMAASIVSCGS